MQPTNNNSRDVTRLTQLVSEIPVYSGHGSPEGVVAAEPGSLYLNKMGGVGESLYVKESGTDPGGWVNSGANVKTSLLNVDHIAEKTSGHGVVIDNALKVNHIAENSSGHNIVHDNIVQRAVQPAFAAYVNTAHTNLTASQTYTVNFNAEHFDVGSNFDTTTKTFTAPVTGYYYLNAQVRIDSFDTAASYYRIGIVTTARTQYHIETCLYTADGSYLTLQTNGVFYMAANDTAYVNAYQSGGTAQADIATSSSYHVFCGYLLG